MQEIQELSSFSGSFIDSYEDFFFADKSIAYDQAKFICERCNINSNSTVLDVGCGTGIFEEILRNKCKEIDALDISKDMIMYAKEHHNHSNVRFFCLDICEKAPQIEAYDSVISISHVVGYQLTNERLTSYFTNIGRALKSGGVLGFNFYNEPALWGNLCPQYKSVNTDEKKIIRISNAKANAMKNLLDLQYKYIIENTRDNNIVSIDIKEEMRYFTVLELEKYLWEGDMRIKEILSYSDDRDLGADDWNGWIVAQKK